jgi:hypothetical protein
MHTRARTHTYTLTHSLTHSLSLSLSLSVGGERDTTYAYARARARTHTHTHTHTHGPSLLRCKNEEGFKKKIYRSYFLILLHYCTSRLVSVKKNCISYPISDVYTYPSEIGYDIRSFSMSKETLDPVLG